MLHFQKNVLRRLLSIFYSLGRHVCCWANIANIDQYRQIQYTPVFPAVSNNPGYLKFPAFPAVPNNPGYLEFPAFSARTETCFHNICFVFFFHLLLPLWNPVYRFFPPFHLEQRVATINGSRVKLV